MPLIIMAGDPGKEDPDEWDVCSMCGEASVALVFVRLMELLLGICPDCASALNKAHAVQSARRMARREMGG